MRKKKAAEISERRKLIEKAFMPSAPSGGGVSVQSKESGGAPGREVFELIKINLNDMGEYYRWSASQAKSSFWLAAAMCASGFLLMALTFVLILAFGVQTGVAAIPAAGGALIEFIAGTALWVYYKSAAQLNHYHAALHEDQRFLSAVSLTDKFGSAEEKDKLLGEIIRAEIALNASGQASGIFTK